MRLTTQEPVRGRQKQQIIASSVALSCLEDRLAPRHDVAPVTVEQHDPAEAVDDEVVDQVSQQVEIRPRRGRKSAGEIDMVVRIAQPQQRRPDRSVTECLGCAADDLAEQHAVGEHGQMMPMLLDGRDRHHDRHVLRGPRHRGPAHLLKLQEDFLLVSSVLAMSDRFSTR